MNISVARRYAKALFEVALEKEQLTEIENDLTVANDILSSTSELTAWLNHPAVEQDVKKDLFAKSFESSNPYVFNLLLLLVERGREDTLNLILTEYKALANHQRGVAEAVVTSAFPLSEDDKKQIVNTFEPKIGKTLSIKEVVNSDLLGGIIVQIGDRLYDGSLKSKLTRFQKDLQGKQVG
ncbi:F0F1 ATP synthase subunit delta [Hazenella sp. IB182357]|uniref:ATP synthase subunit delta n=1 Tax=Polycladospora coralii TaxID=2771432 RepID=A0A926N6I4_9BACL|nr:F0F1 ATP synthase subunit delta [Polycladospora coralii]MBD1372131.1 F0F1 ATP synthase subunit delta [Polycladospora coralii]MBS7530637.1 F0F1 ATP synthase subunit delta [Polycladospora coralii]